MRTALYARLVTAIYMVEIYIAQGVDAGNTVMEDFDRRHDTLVELIRLFQTSRVDEAHAFTKKKYCGESSKAIRDRI